MTLNLMVVGFAWWKIVAAVEDVPVAHQDQGLVPGVVLADAILDLEAGQRANPRVGAKVVPSHHDQSHVPDPRVVILGINQSRDPPVRRRIRNPGLALAPDRSPGTKAVQGV